MSGVPLLEEASSVIDRRAEALGATGHGLELSESDTTPLFVGMPVTAQECHDFTKHCLEHVRHSVQSGHASSDSAVLGMLQHVLLTGIVVGQRAVERDA